MIGEMAAYFRAVFWLAMTGVGWYAGYGGVDGEEGILVVVGGSGEHIAVPKGEKNSGVSGSGDIKIASVRGGRTRGGIVRRDLDQRDR